MSKKTRKNNQNLNVQQIKLSDGTIMEQFQEYLKEHKKVSDIITFLSIKNAQMLAYMGATDGIPEDTQKELAEFYDYFMENFDRLTSRARFENWGDEPLILRMGAQYSYNQYIKYRKQFLKEVPANVKDEAELLCEILFQIRAERHLTFLHAEEIFTYDLERTIPKQELEEAREELLYLCSDIILRNGVAVITCEYPDKKIEIFGVRAWDQKWGPIPKEEMYDADTLAPDGTRLEPEDGVVYTEIQKRLHPLKVVK